HHHARKGEVKRPEPEYGEYIAGIYDICIGGDGEYGRDRIDSEVDVRPLHHYQRQEKRRREPHHLPRSRVRLTDEELLAVEPVSQRNVVPEELQKYVVGHVRVVV